jgi:topoisomerase-4 subunit B
VADNGRGMPTDIHPEEGITGVEVILLKLHAGAKFSNKDYQFSGGLHGVGVSVVNALSTRLEVDIKRGRQKHQIILCRGKKQQELEVTGRWASATPALYPLLARPETYFDTPVFRPSAAHTLRAKAVLVPGLTVTFHR